MLARHRRSHIFIKAAIYSGAGLIFLSVFLKTEAATIYWNGGGADTRWATTANWSGSVVPGANDTAMFSGLSVKNATIPASITVRGITISSAYTGTLSQSGGSVLTVGTGSFVQGGGTFRGGTGFTLINGSLTLSGGTLIAPSGGLQVLKNFTKTGGTYNPNHGTLLFDPAGAQTFTPGSTTYGNVTINDGLVGYWKFDETSGTAVLDSSGYGSSGLYNCPSPSTNVPSLTFSNPGSLNFHGIGLTGTINSLSSATGTSIAIWFKTTTTVKTMLVAVGGGAIYINRFTSGKVLPFFDGSTGNDSSDYGSSLNDGNWHLVVGTNNGTTTFTYVDGALVNSRAETFIGPNNSFSIASNDNSFPLTGHADDVRVYNRLLTAPEVSQLYAGNDISGIGLAGYWKLDETSGTTAMDSSGYGSSGIYNCPIASTDVPSVAFSNPRSLNFRGVGVAGTINSLVGTTGYSISLWFKTTTTVKSFLASIGQGAIYINRFTSGKVLPFFDGSTGNDSTDYGTSLNDGAWHHVVGINNGSTTYTYVDGVLANSRSETLISPSSSFGIGSADDQVTFPLTGSIDDVRIYDRALSATEVSRLYAGNERASVSTSLTLAGPLALSGSLKMYAGTLDVSSSSYTITLSGSLINNGGSFLSQNGTVRLNGVNQALSGIFPFFNLTKSAAAADTLTIAAGSALTINGSIAMAGSVNGNLTVVSDIPGSRWSISTVPSTVFDHLILSDSNNASLAILECSSCTNNGNNTRWSFTTPTTNNTSSSVVSGSSGGGGGGSRYIPAEISFSASSMPSSISSSSRSARSTSSSSAISHPAAPSASYDQTLSTILRTTNLRKNPSATSSLIVTLLKDWKVSIQGFTGLWAKVKTMGGKEGYIIRKNISDRSVSSASNSSVSQSNSAPNDSHTLVNLNVRINPAITAKVIAQLPKNTSVNILETIGDWLKISFEGKTGFVVGKWVKQ